eukprot:NODE_363_length_8763_cov_0.834718.p2 type:complete len:367 gc:universal NODE_363_length_8763_cov_0.834718:3735-2635(-)
MSSSTSESSTYIYKTNPIKLLEKPQFTVKGHSFTNPFFEGKFYVLGRVTEVRFQLQKLGGQMATFYNQDVTHVVVPDEVFSWYEIHKNYCEEGLEYWMDIPNDNILTESGMKILHSVAINEKRVWKAEKVHRWIRFLKLDKDNQALKRSHSLTFDDNSKYKKSKTDGRWKSITNKYYYAYVCENTGTYKPIISKIYHKLNENESQSPHTLTKFHSTSKQTPFIEPSSVSEKAFDDNESGYTRVKSIAASIHSRKSLPVMKNSDRTSLSREIISQKLNDSLLTPSQSILAAKEEVIVSSSEVDLDVSSVGRILSEEDSEDSVFNEDELAIGVSRKYHNIATKEGYCELCGERFKDFIKVYLFDLACK